jgi:hypothetical protein
MIFLFNFLKQFPTTIFSDNIEDKFFEDLEWLSSNTHFSPGNIVEWHKVKVKEERTKGCVRFPRKQFHPANYCTGALLPL